MPKLPQPKPGILDIAPYTPGKSKGTAGVRIVKLSSNENPLGASPKAMKAVADSAAEINRYPDGASTALREAIAETYKLPAANLVCGAGSDELIGLIIRAYASAGDEILMSRHGFLMYKIYAQGFGVSINMAPEKNLHTDVDAMLAAVTKRTKVVLVANPNNPTGTYISKSEMQRLHAGLPSDVLLVIDDAYAEYADKADYSTGEDLVAASQNVLMMRTFSKIYGLSALRVGWMYAPAHVVDVMNRIRGPFNVSAPAAAAAIAAVKDQAFVNSTRAHNNEQLAWMQKELTALGLSVVPSIGNFVLVKFPEGKHSASAANAYLAEHGLIVRDVVAYGLPEYLRITIGLGEDNQAVVKTLASFLKS